MTLIQFTNRITPYMCRLLARKTVGEKSIQRLKVEEIAERAGLSVRTVIRLSHLHDWSGVDVGTASSFMEACGIDPTNLDKHMTYLRWAGKNPNSAFKYLRSKRVANHLASLIPTSQPLHTAEGRAAL